MKFLKLTLFLLITLFTVLGMQSCKDNCEVDCQNGGTCVDGTCDCPDGYIGDNCESFNASMVQELLANYTPLELIKGGVPLDSLYGKFYKDGLIFYLNCTDGTGMVSAVEDQSTGVEWGCTDNEIMNLNNVTTFPQGSEILEGARIGDGMTNTNAILTECTEDNIAARLCRNLGEEWFLPSRGELDLIYANLFVNGYGGFVAGGLYWNSTERDNGTAWYRDFLATFPSVDEKYESNYVRAARAF